MKVYIYKIHDKETGVADIFVSMHHPNSGKIVMGDFATHVVTCEDELETKPLLKEENDNAA